MSGYAIKPAQRWVILPDDPAPLKAWLRVQQARTAQAERDEQPPTDNEEPTWRS